MSASVPFLRHDRGVSIVEFALVLPLLVLIGVGGTELINYIVATQKVIRVAALTSDTVARATIAPSERTILDTFRAVDHVAAPLRVSARGRTIITAVIGVHVGSRVLNRVAWQRCAGRLTTVSSAIGSEWKGTANIADGPSVQLPGKVELLQNQIAIVSEVAYRYEPLVSGLPIPGTPADGIIRQQSVFVARGRPFPTLTPSPNIEEARCS